MDKPYNLGVTAGKFMPFHKGHQAMIQRLVDLCERPVVILAWEPGESPDYLKRQEWLHTTFPDITVLTLRNPANRDDNSEFWGQLTIKLLGAIPQVVVGSEQYTKTWAQAMNCEYEALDRINIPVSGTLIRKFPMMYFDYLTDAARAFYTKRVYLVGGESVGKSTLCAQLAEYYRTVWVPEYGRTYSEEHGTDPDDLGIWPAILSQQPKMWADAELNANRLMFCDTDLICTLVWFFKWRANREMNIWRDIEAGIEAQPNGLYLLLDHSVDWIQDDLGTRTHVTDREWFTNSITNQLLAREKNFVVVAGNSYKQRMSFAINTIDDYLKE